MTAVLYGATGYTGRLVIDELVRAGADFAIAGRDGTALAELSRTRAEGAPWHAVDVGDAAGLRGLLADAPVVINCAGPFSLTGDAVAAAAVETGTHYVDSTGEQSFMHSLFERHGPAAERAGVALVPAMGFDYVPGDCLAAITCRGLEPVEELVLAYSLEGFGMSRGTMRSALEMMKGGDLVYRDGEWRPAPGGVFRASFDFGPPLGRQPMSRYPAGEIVTVPRHTRVRNVTALLTTSTAAPSPAAARILPFTMPATAALLRTPLRGAIGRAIGRLPEGPPEEQRRRARFTICARATAASGKVATGRLEGEDVYGLTAVMLVQAAARMAADGYDRAGALGPAAAFDPVELLDGLRSHRLSWTAGTATVPA